MTHTPYTSKSKPKGVGTGLPIGAVLITVASVIVICFLGWWGFHTLGPQENKPAMVDPSNPTYDWIKLKAHECGGDVNKLSSADRTQLENVTRGHGAQVMQSEWAARH